MGVDTKACTCRAFWAPLPANRDSFALRSLRVDRIFSKAEAETLRWVSCHFGRGDNTTRTGRIGNTVPGFLCQNDSAVEFSNARRWRAFFEDRRCFPAAVTRRSNAPMNGGVEFRTSGVGDGDRTRDIRCHRPTLYQLSYAHRRIYRGQFTLKPASIEMGGDLD